MSARFVRQTSFLRVWEEGVIHDLRVLVGSKVSLAAENTLWLECVTTMAGVGVNGTAAQRMRSGTQKPR